MLWQEKKKNKKIKNVQWLVGSIEKKWKELEKTDVLVHLATYGGYERFPKFKDCYNFNFLKSKNWFKMPITLDVENC